MRWQCWRLRARLVDFAADVLPATERERIASHVGHCDRCAVVVAALQDVPAQLLTLPPVAADEVFFRRQHDAIMRTVRTQPEVRQASGFAWPWVFAPAVAATAALVLAVTMWRPPSHAPTLPALDALDVDTLLSVADVARTFAPDGHLTGDAGWHPIDDLHEVDDQDLVILRELIGGDT